MTPQGNRESNKKWQIKKSIKLTIWYSPWLRIVLTRVGELNSFYVRVSFFFSGFKAEPVVISGRPTHFIVEYLFAMIGMGFYINNLI